jgi:hypothetical protein
MLRCFDSISLVKSKRVARELVDTDDDVLRFTIENNLRLEAHCSMLSSSPEAPPSITNMFLHNVYPGFIRTMARPCDIPCEKGMELDAKRDWRRRDDKHADTPQVFLHRSLVLFLSLALCVSCQL